MTSRLAHIHLHADRGWRVFPTGPNKHPLIKDWPNKASTCHKQIQQWWSEHPHANVGIATGPQSGIWVVDIDVKNGVNGWQSLQEKFGEVQVGDSNLVVETPSGGIHLYYTWTENLELTVAANVLRGVDLRGQNGFIMAPPSSIEIDGQSKPYQFLNNPDQVPEAPEWAIALSQMTGKTTTKRSAKGKSTTFNPREVMEGIHQGNRDDALYRYACHLRGCDVPFDLAAGFIQEAAARCIPPFCPDTALEKIKRAYATLPTRNTIFSLK